MKPLPIDLIDPNRRPPRFRWQQTVSTLTGDRTITQEGTLPLNVEMAVAQLVILAHQQAKEIEELKKMVNVMAERVAAQSDLLSKKAEQPVKGKR